MITPPKNQGQIVECSYGSDSEYAYRQILDRSEGAGSPDRERWYRASWADIHGATPEGVEYEWEPQDREPMLPAGIQWDRCEAPRD